MKFNITTRPEKFFRQLIELLRPLSPFTDLTEREAQVFSELLYWNNELRDVFPDRKERMPILFSYETRQKIIDKVGISKEQSYNLYMSLRRKGLLNKEEIDSKYELTPDHMMEVTFKFEWIGEEETKPS